MAHSWQSMYCLLAHPLIYILFLSGIINTKKFVIHVMFWCIHKRRASVQAGWITASIISHCWFTERTTWAVPSKPHSNLLQARPPGNNWHQRLSIFLPLLLEVSRNPTGTVLAQLLSLRSFIMCAVKLYPIFWVYPKHEADFRLQPGRVWPLGSENGLHWVCLTSKGVQIWIQDRHVHNHGLWESSMSTT